MPDRLSRNQIDRLGERLRRSEFVSEEDLRLLQTVREEYDEILALVAARLADELGQHPGTRLKTVGTIVDKLKRESIRLSQMQDIAGARLVTVGSRDDQDLLVEGILQLFPGANVVDRRASPSQGYRAVHVIVTIERRFIEIQVRTEFQDLWAQVLERMADAYGRQIRYGGEASDPESEAHVRAMLAVADKIAVAEEGDRTVARLMSGVEQKLDRLPPEAMLPEIGTSVLHAAAEARGIAGARATMWQAVREALWALVVRDFRE